jgi:hypothetical protein|tara:strand:- start:499 stop:1302 length:804 start_codon:yes stop_codon:yes gene_type:complete
MKVAIRSFSIARLSKFPLLVHATSPRHYEVGDGGKRPLFSYGNRNKNLFKTHQQWFLNSLGIKNEFVYRVRQVHGNRVYVLNDPLVSVEQVEKEEADAIVTHLPGRSLAVLTADCIPIIIYDPVRHVTGVVHAGRKGTEKFIFSSVIEILVREYGSSPQDLTVGMGPAIRGCCYEVDKSCISPFLERTPRHNGWVREAKSGKFLLDLLEANRQEGAATGIPLKNIDSDGPCTSCDSHRWYSYRKEGATGRMMTLAMLLRRDSCATTL